MKKHIPYRLIAFFICTTLAILSIVAVTFFTREPLSFKSIAQAQQFADTHPEYVEPDNYDWLDPSFHSYHDANLPTWWQRILDRLHITTSRWSAYAFKHLLETLTHQRELNGYFGRFVQKITPQPNTRFILWGDLHGAFHSLTRDLVTLKSFGAITDDLIVQKPYYFVFNGNVIDRSPYTLETLYLVMQLMYKNPDRVIYLLGNHEDKQFWHNSNLARELDIKCIAFEDSYIQSNNQIPLDKSITTFFNTLPLALYLTQLNVDPQKIEALRISYWPRYFDEINEDNFANFLDKPSAHLTSFNVSQKDVSDKKLTIPVIVKGEDRSTQFKTTTGLVTLNLDKESNAWSILSSPIGAHRREYDFFYDAFVELFITPNIKDWTLTLYNQDVRTMFGIKKSVTFNASSGIQIEDNSSQKNNATAASHADTQEILLGTAVGITRGLGPAGKAFAAGIQLRINEAQKNATRGHIMPQIDIKDDEYDPVKTRAIMEQFIKNGISIIVTPPGNPTLASYYDLIKEKKLLVLFPSTGVPDSYTAEYPYILHYRGSDIFEGRVLAEYAITNLKSQQAILFIQNDNFGLALLEGVHQTLKKHNITNWVEIKHERNELDFKNQIEKIRADQKFDTIIFLDITTAAQGLVRELGVEYLIGKNILGNSDFGDDKITSFFKEKGLPLTKLSVVPNVQVSTLPIVEQFRAAAKKENIPFNPFTLESYIATDLALELINRVQGPVTKEKIVEVAEHIKNETYKGLTLNFIPETRQLGRPLWVNTGDPDWKTVQEVGGDIVIEK